MGVSRRAAPRYAVKTLTCDNGGYLRGVDERFPTVADIRVQVQRRVPP